MPASTVQTMHGFSLQVGLVSWFETSLVWAYYRLNYLCLHGRTQLNETALIMSVVLFNFLLLINCHQETVFEEAKEPKNDSRCKDYHF